MTDKDVSFVSSHLRGDAGTTFLLKIQRPSTGKTLQKRITRRAIQLPSLPYYGLRKNGIGYINLNSFTEDCSRDFRRAFIGKVKRGNHEYRTTVEPIDTVMPVVVMVNGETASASEITSGSLQDLDRAVVLGTRTYGKGLVQTPLDLPYNAQMKLTTSKYYIPSGRCIQAINYKHANGGYLEHIPDSLTKVFYTANGREVRDGGGIKPDIEVKPDSLPNIAFYLSASGRDSTEVMQEYVIDYISRHPTIAPAAEFCLTDADFAEFKQRVIASGFTYDPESEKVMAQLKKMMEFEGYMEDAKPEFEALEKKLGHNLDKDLDRHKALIMQLLQNEIVAAYYYQGGSIANTLQYDKQMKAAEEILLDTERYNKILKPEVKG